MGKIVWKILDFKRAEKESVRDVVGAVTPNRTALRLHRLIHNQ